MEKKVIITEKELKNLISETIIFETFKDEIYRMIIESHGISDEISTFLYKNRQKLLETIIEKMNSGKADENGVEYSISTLRIPAFVKTFLDKNYNTITKEHTILFTFHIFNFPDKNKFNKLKNYYRINDGETRTDGKKYNWIDIYCYAVNRKINQPDFFDTIGHELSHVFKQDMAGTVIPKNNRQYLKFVNDIYSEDSVDRSISEILYYSEKFEQEGFINGLYYFFKEKGAKILRWNDLKGSEAWKSYLKLQNALFFVTEHKDEVQSVLDIKYNGKQIDNLIKIGNYGLKSFKEKLLRVLFKYNEDNINEGIHWRGKYLPGMYIN